jgi:hypothetical protein
MENKDKYQHLFMSLVSSFEFQTLIALGKLKNPITDKIEKELAHAQSAIDMLDMLSEKTKGNLSEYEKSYLENTISQLKLNYVEESNKPQENTDSKKEAEQNSK